MKKNLQLLTLFFLFSLKLIAQQPADLLSSWSKLAPIEKIYLHLDRENYIAGETIWFKAYLSSEYFPDTISSNLYTELLGPSSHQLVRNIYPILAATSHGQIEIPDTLTTGYYLLRSYTPTMLSQDSDFVYLRSIFIYGKEPRPAVINNSGKIKLTFFPEGGNAVNNIAGTVAFKATDENGIPVAVSGQVKNDRNETVAPLTTMHDGMGMFEWTPTMNEKYYAVLDGDPVTHYALPDCVEKGIVLSIIPHPQGQFFEIRQPGDDPVFKAAYMVGQMQHIPVFTQKFPANQKEMQGVINCTHLHSGILQVTVFNAENMPLAERICFVNNKEYVQDAQVVADTLNFAPYSRNRFSLKLKDTVQGSFSISITDPVFEKNGSREENIYSRMLLSSDLNGYVHNPAWYFSSDDDSVKTALDLVMMTNGWRRFKWTEILRSTAMRPRYTDRGFITVSGKALLRGTKKPYAGRPLLVMVYDPTRKRIIQLTSTDPLGKFHVDSLIYFGKGRILFSDIKGKKSEYIDVVLDGDSIGRSFKLPPADKGWMTRRIVAPSGSFQNDYDAIRKANGLLLENVTVKAVRKSPLQEVEDRYTKGAFSGDAVKSIDLVNSDEAAAYGNIFDYLQARINGLQVSQDENEYAVYYRQQSTMSTLGTIPMVLYLDEVETDASFIAVIPANQIALVKIYESFAAATGNAPGGVLAIYTKSGTDYVPRNGPVSYGIYQGYSVIKEFYAPDYHITRDDSKPDNRITLDWRPDILSNYVNPSIPFSFYNNSRTKQFHVVVEGMTTSGKMVCVDKIYAAPQR